MFNQQEIATPSNWTISPRRSYLPKKNTFSPTRKLVYFATLIAIVYTLKLLGNFLTFGPFRITLSYFGFFLSSIVLSPLGGALVTLVSDVLSQLLGGLSGLPNPLIALGNCGGTFLFGVVYFYLPCKNTSLRICIACLIFVVFATLGFNSLANYLLYFKGTNYLVYLLTQRLVQVPIAFVNSALIICALPLFRKIKLIC